MLYYTTTYYILRMEYSKNYTVSKDHTDQNCCMYCTYYPYYMELCRRDYLRDVLGFDLAKEANRDIYMKVTQYSIKTLGVLKKGENFTVTCSVFLANDEKQHFSFKQCVIIDGAIICIGIFSVNCVMASKRNPCG